LLYNETGGPIKTNKMKAAQKNASLPVNGEANLSSKQERSKKAF